MQYIISGNGLTFFSELGTPYQVRSDHINFAAIRDGLINESRSLEELINLSDNVIAVQTQIDSLTSGKYLQKGKVEVSAAGVFYDGELVDSSLTHRMIRMIQQNKDAHPWVKFMEKLYTNPNHTTRFELYDWLSSCDLPLTLDGDFIAYKKVKEDYTDFYSGKFSNKIGQRVALPDRAAVDPIRTNVCSRGLHFCSGSYLTCYYGSKGRVMILKINPADVVSIPTDYNFAKGRTWQYDVVGEITQERAQTREWPGVVGSADYNVSITESEYRAQFERTNAYA